MFDTFKKLYEKKNILITGGAGFIGGALIRKLLKDYELNIYNLDKLTYASNLISIEKTLTSIDSDKSNFYHFLKVDLCNQKNTSLAIKYADPDLVIHLAAESHVDRSIKYPQEFINSNINGTFNLLDSLREHYDNLEISRKRIFRFHHISTDEVYGSLDKYGSFDESTPYKPSSPYSASKASSDHLVQAWHNTFGLPTLISNSSNNYGPWQLPDKLIPKIIINSLNNKEIPIYGNGSNIRDWLFVEDHVEAILRVLFQGEIGQKYCIGGNEEKTNNQIATLICNYLDKIRPRDTSYKRLIKYVSDRAGHDYRYKSNISKMKKELNWMPNFSFEKGIEYTVKWYIKNSKFIQNLNKDQQSS